MADRHIVIVKDTSPLNPPAMSTAPDLLLPSSSSMLPDVGGALNEDEDDAAGYQAMMSELPTIVSMSGLLDGDFDELNGKIQS